MIPNEIRVLVVDDEAMVCRMLKAYLEMRGLSVDIALTGAEALAMLVGGGYRAAIVDMRLPDMTGDEMIAHAGDDARGTQFLIHTGSLDFRLSDRLRAAGIAEDDIIRKPVRDMGEIYDAVMRAAGR